MTKSIGGYTAYNDKGGPMVENPGFGATAELELTEPMRQAIDCAFDQARARVRSEGGFVPFTVLCCADGLVAVEHDGETADEVHDSVTDVLEREVPESYVLAYDGFVETDAGRSDAVLCEAAKRGDALAYLLAMPYVRTVDGIDFSSSYLSAGTTGQLYPREARPLSPGLAALVERHERAATEAAVGPEVEVEDAVAPVGCGADEAAAPAHDVDRADGRQAG